MNFKEIRIIADSCSGNSIYCPFSKKCCTVLGKGLSTCYDCYDYEWFQNNLDSGYIEMNSQEIYIFVGE